MSCSNFDDSYGTLIVSGSVNTDIRAQMTTYKIKTYNNNARWTSIINYRTKIGTFEIGDTLLLVKKSNSKLSD